MGNTLGGACKLYERPGDHWDKFKHITTPYPTPSKDVTQPMNLPLSAYILSSGHNSYLTGNQLSSDSGTSTIEKCLKAGCRVIELDVYNKQGAFTGPVCKHGGTATAPVSFEDCVKAVATHAFASSPYPAIITLESHADEDNQAQMAAILEQVLGDKLYVPAPDEVGTMWKSPEALKGKVLIRANGGKAAAPLKRLLYIHNTKFESLPAANKSGKTSSSSFNEAKARKLVKKAMAAAGVAMRSDTMARPTKSGAPVPPEVKATAQAAWVKAAGQPAAAGGDKPDVGEVVGQAVEQPADEASEEVVESLHSLGELYAYSAANLMRVYPGGLRVDSSNYDPCLAWSAGASLAALNWQKWDQPMWVNSAMFAQNGGCGFVLKPEWQRSALSKWGEPPSQGSNGSDGGVGPNPLPARNPRTLSVHVYSAHAEQGGNFSIWKDDLYLQMEVVGMPQDCAVKYTPTAHNTGRLRVDKEFRFEVYYPELAVLVVALKDEDFQPGKGLDDVLGHWEVALAGLVPGEYMIHLTDGKQRVRPDRWMRVKVGWAAESSAPAVSGEVAGGQANPLSTGTPATPATA